MVTERIKQLEIFMKEDPSDPFPKYALALEYQTQNPAKAKSLFIQLLESHSEYTATYYHAADFFFQINEIEKAKVIYEKGLKILKEKNETKALHELQNAYQNFLFEIDD